MILILILLGLVVGGCMLFKYADKTNRDGLTFIGLIAIIIPSMLLISLPVVHIGSINDVVVFKSYVATNDLAREKGDDLEGAAFRQTIAEANASLASMQYWNNFWLTDAFITDEVDSLKPIE